MKNLDEIALINKKHWERMVDGGCGFTRPWLDLDREKISQYLKGQLHYIPEHLLEMHPKNILIISRVRMHCVLEPVVVSNQQFLGFL